MPWTEDELRRIAATDDLHIAPFREDGKTFGTPTWIWAVVVDGTVYVRAWNGERSRWYQAAMRERAGIVRVAGMTRDVTFEPVDGPVHDRIDAAYRARYAGSPYLAHMIAAGSRAATVEIRPREVSA